MWDGTVPGNLALLYNSDTLPADLVNQV